MILVCSYSRGPLSCDLTVYIILQETVHSNNVGALSNRKIQSFWYRF